MSQDTSFYKSISTVSKLEHVKVVINLVVVLQLT